MAGEKRPAKMPLHVEQTLRDRATMSTEIFGAYLSLLLIAWDQQPGGSLPNDDRALAGYARLGIQRWRSIKQMALAPFHLGDDGRWHHAPTRREYEKAARRLAAASSAAAIRWTDARAVASINDAPDDATASPDECQNQPERQNCASNSSFLNTRKTPSPPPSKDSTPLPRKGLQKEEEGEDLLTEDQEWEGIGRLVRQQGLVDSGSAIAAARAAGCKPCEVAMLIAHFEAYPKAWGEGLLHHRIKTLQPGDDPTKGWPEKSHDWKLAQESKFKKAMALAPTEADIAAENRRREEARERTYGPLVDAMTDADVDDAVRSNQVLIDRLKEARRHGKDPRKGLLRDTLLAHVEKAATSV
jgi:uncharacterized protein YdaU (DUF1376 family)